MDQLQQARQGLRSSPVCSSCRPYFRTARHSSSCIVSHSRCALPHARCVARKPAVASSLTAAVLCRTHAVSNENAPLRGHNTAAKPVSIGVSNDQLTFSPCLQGGLTGSRATNIMLHRLAGKVVEDARKHVATEAARKALEAQIEADTVAEAAADGVPSKTGSNICTFVAPHAWPGLRPRLGKRQRLVQ